MKRIMTFTSLLLAGTITLSGCAAGDHQQGLEAAGSNASASPSADPNGNRFPVGDVVNDGQGDYALAALPDDDPSYTWDLTRMEKDVVSKGFTPGDTAAAQKDVLAAQKVAENYVNDAIQAPDIHDSPKPVLAAYEHRIVDKYFHSGYKFDETGEHLPQTYDNQYGNDLYHNEGDHLLGSFLDYDANARRSAAFGYDYGKDKERLVSRVLTMEGVGLGTTTTSTLGDFNVLHKDTAAVEVGKTLTMAIHADFASKSLLNGQPVVDRGNADFSISLAKENGKFVIVDASNGSYTH